ncbi:MAG: hypothetical protein HC887_06610 [Desulfobacteraceae bacterium]|nr:hypothetical protein [Desulfobacteraceae bacterium]
MALFFMQLCLTFFILTGIFQKSNKAPPINIKSNKEKNEYGETEIPVSKQITNAYSYWHTDQFAYSCSSFTETFGDTGLLWRDDAIRYDYKSAASFH